MSIPKEHVHIPCLTPWIDFVGILGFQNMALRYQTPCIPLLTTVQAQCTVLKKQLTWEKP